MSDLGVGLGLVLVIEGLIWALAPGMGKSMAETAASVPPATLRLFGLGAVTLGVAIVWLVRG
jgi:uncharacterized protein